MINAEWSEDEINEKRIINLQKRGETTSKHEGVISIDDTPMHKTETSLWMMLNFILTTQQLNIFWVIILFLPHIKIDKVAIH